MSGLPNLSRAQSWESDEIDLLGVAQSLWSCKWRIAGVTTFALMIGEFYSLHQTPIYRADGLLQLEAKRSALELPVGMQDLFSRDTSPGTELEIIRSRMVLGRVVDELELDILAEPLRLPFIGGVAQRIGLPRPELRALEPYAWSSEAIEVSELEMPRNWLGKNLRLIALGEERYRILLPNGTEREGVLSERLADIDAGFSLRVDRLDAQPGRVFVIMRQHRRSAISALRGSVSVSETSRGSAILRLEVIGPDPERAARTLDMVARAYLAQNVDRSAAEAQRSLAFIEEQLPAAKTAVADAEAVLNNYRQRAQSVDISFETQALLERASVLEEQLAKLELEEQSLADRYTRSHPAYQALLRSQSQIEADLSALRQETGALPETQKEIFNLTRNLEVAQQIYFQLLNRAQELEVLRASTIGSVRIIDTAQPSNRPIEPRRSRIMILFGLLGLLTSAAWVIIEKALRQGVRGSEDLERIGLPAFATIPYASEADSKRKTPRGRADLLALIKPDSITIEAIRSLRTALYFGLLDTQSKTVLITSGAPDAGKSFTAANLAVVCAQGGQSVCLIDADLRRGQLRRFFELERDTPGLSDYLSDRVGLDEVLHASQLSGLFCIPSGQFPPNPSELLMRPNFGALIEALEQRFDLIIVDSAPALAVTDPVIIGNKTGAILLVTRHLVTSASEIEVVRSTFEAAGLRITGATLNAWRIEEASRYGKSYGRYYNHRYK